MKLEAQSRLWKDISAVPKSIKREALGFIDDIEHMTLADACASYDFKPMKTHSAFYRLRIDNYRLGCRYNRTNDTLLLMRFLHREIMYDHFP